ncbi:MAG TPA: DUF3592 domain-containing protein [Planctomycetota bacterium]|nr:DUF3592 domain-containing protein [Planctomycetota bacterium]
MNDENPNDVPRRRPSRTLVSASGLGLLLVGLGCLAWGGYGAWRTYRFVDNAARATGTIFYAAGNESNSVLVEVRAENGRVVRTLPVSVAWWTPPWRYNRGETVTVLYDPQGDYDAPLFGDRARVDAWGQLWVGSLLWCTAGVVCVGLWVLVRGSRGRVVARLHLGVETDRTDV